MEAGRDASRDTATSRPGRTDASAKGLPKKRLTLTAAGEQLEFADVWPRQRLAEIVEQLGGQA